MPDCYDFLVVSTPYLNCIHTQVHTQYFPVSAQRVEISRVEGPEGYKSLLIRIASTPFEHVLTAHSMKQKSALNIDQFGILMATGCVMTTSSVFRTY
jgi:hypothetical protein